MNTIIIKKSFIWGLAASMTLMGIYFIAVGAISGESFARQQFSQYWYFLVTLALGFGLQIGLYSYLRQAIKQHNMHGAGKTIAVTGATSTLAMISCCAHYLANIIPILGIAGALAVVAQYQVQFFWIGLLFNIFGIIYISRQVIKFHQQL
jgi:Cu+-exporting ATPase